MTSNEKLDDLISSAFGCDIMYYQGEYEEEIKLYLELKQELKVLDVLKPYFEGAILDGDFHFRFTPEQEKIIKEWLNNGK